jgi:hypothetical protein
MASDHEESGLRKLVLNLLKLLVSGGILAYLFVDAYRHHSFVELRDQPKNWGMLAGAAVICCLGVLITLVRWHFLIRALGLPVRWRETLRIGLVGFLFNLSPVGIVGGDLLKMVMLARRCPGRRAEAAATVVFDRIMGLYVLFVVASAAILLNGWWQASPPSVHAICQGTLWVTLLGTAAMVVLLVPNLTNGRTTALVARLPHVGPIAERLLTSIRMYRRSPGVLALSAVLSVAVHSCITFSIALLAVGLYGHAPSLAEQFVMVPLANATGVLPIVYGPFEWALNQLYAIVPLADGTLMKSGQGLVVALAYRIVTVAVAAAGMGCYLAIRREVEEVLHSGDAAVLAGDLVNS